MLPYISAKVNNLSKKVMEFNGNGETLFTNNIGVNGSISSEAWGTAFQAVGGMLRSDNTSFLSLDGKTYSFVTSIGDAHLCQNSYWNGVDWLKYDPAQASGHLLVSGGQLRFKRSDAGSSDPLQHDDWVYHTGYRPTPADIGAYTKDEVDSLGRVHIKDVRGGILPPDSFATHNMSLWFNELNGPTVGWYSGINMRGWGDAYASWQLVSGSDIPDSQVADASKTALWFRSGYGDAWGEYQKVYTTKHKPTAADIGAAPSGYGLGEYGRTIGTVLGDCELRRVSGFFQGSNIAGIPAEGHTWKYVFSQAHSNIAGYFGYLAIDYYADRAWIGGQEGGVIRNTEITLQGKRVKAGSPIGNDYHQCSVEVLGNGDEFKPTIGFYQPGGYAGSLSLWA